MEAVENNLGTCLDGDSESAKGSEVSDSHLRPANSLVISSNQLIEEPDSDSQLMMISVCLIP